MVCNGSSLWFASAGCCDGVRTCVAAGCSNTNKDGVRLFQFPKDKARRKKWADQVKRHRDKWEPTDHSVLCSKHFEDLCFLPDTLLTQQQTQKIPAVTIHHTNA